jgi:hypothetical protein
LFQIFRICRHGKVPYRRWPQRRFTSAGLLHHPLTRSMDQVAGSSTPAPGPNALPFGTPGATDAAQALCFGASPLVRATALPAPPPRVRKKSGARCCLTRQTRRASCPRLRCPRRSGRSGARPFRARTRHRWARRLSDAADCFAVEGTVSAAGGGTRAGAYARLCHGAGACRL